MTNLYYLLFLPLFSFALVGGSYVTLWASEEIPKIKKYIRQAWHNMFFIAVFFFFLEFFSITTLGVSLLLAILFSFVLTLASYHRSSGLILIGFFTGILSLNQLPLVPTSLFLLCCILAGALAVINKQQNLRKSIVFPVLFFLVGGVVPWVMLLLF